MTVQIFWIFWLEISNIFTISVQYYIYILRIFVKITYFLHIYDCVSAKKYNNLHGKKSQIFLTYRKKAKNSSIFFFLFLLMHL